jgi:hypothetical protein
MKSVAFTCFPAGYPQLSNLKGEGGVRPRSQAEHKGCSAAAAGPPAAAGPGSDSRPAPRLDPALGLRLSCHWLPARHGPCGRIPLPSACHSSAGAGRGQFLLLMPFSKLS